MRCRQEIVCEGEWLGPVDWSYDFNGHIFGGVDKLAKFRALVALLDAGKKAQVVTFETWRDVHHVGMWDGWPYWKPTPAFVADGPLGTETHFWYDVKAIREKEAPAPKGGGA